MYDVFVQSVRRLTCVDHVLSLHIQGKLVKLLASYGRYPTFYKNTPLVPVLNQKISRRPCLTFRNVVQNCLSQGPPPLRSYSLRHIGVPGVPNANVEHCATLHLWRSCRIVTILATDCKANITQESPGKLLVLALY